MTELCEQIDDYLDQTLPLEGTQKFETHLETCGHCRKQVQDHGRLSLLLGEAWQHVQASESLQESIREGIHTANREPVSTTAALPEIVDSNLSFFAGRRTLIAGLIGIAALVFVMFSFWSNPSDDQSKTAKKVEVTSGELAKNQLIPAGSLQPVVQVQPLNIETETLALPAKRTSPNFTIVNLYSTRSSDVDP